MSDIGHHRPRKARSARRSSWAGFAIAAWLAAGLTACAEEAPSEAEVIANASSDMLANAVEDGNLSADTQASYADAGNLTSAEIDPD